MLNYYFKSSIRDFLAKSTEEIIGSIAISDQFPSTQEQRNAWRLQIPILKNSLQKVSLGSIFFEFSIPRMGSRVDSLVIVENIVFVIEFKVGESNFYRQDIDQVWDYALDLKNFHQPSHHALVVPILVSTEAGSSSIEISLTPQSDNLTFPLLSNAIELPNLLEKCMHFFGGGDKIDTDIYAKGSYHPTPTIIEAAVSLYNKHTVDEITRSDAAAKNLSLTTRSISDVIAKAKKEKEKVICFVTGVPGAGKTLVGLKVATSHMDKQEGNTSVYLSGNAPLVAILQEALTRDKVKNETASGNKITKRKAKEGVKAFIQIIHHYRDAYLVDKSAPYDHVAIFDEAQRAWNREQTIKFMKQKKNEPNFEDSEPEFLISCLDRHEDWAVVICLVGGGQEINTGEAGISEWLEAILGKFKEWEVVISPNLTDSEYAARDAIESLNKKGRITFNDDMHLGVSMRSFRAENVSNFVKHLLDLNQDGAMSILTEISSKYPIVLTRSLSKAKVWLKEMARGSERYGIVVSSQAQRLKPFAIDVKSPMDPVNWFLDGKNDVRSSYYLEAVATEFHIQGLEFDWVCITWDGDLRHDGSQWNTYSFRGSKWQRIIKEERKRYLLNAYRVLLTRARQGMIIVVPEGDQQDHTRSSQYYDGTFNYLKGIGLKII